MAHKSLHRPSIQSRAVEFGAIGCTELVQIPDLAFVIVPAPVTAPAIESSSVYQPLQSAEQMRIRLVRTSAEYQTGGGVCCAPRLEHFYQTFLQGNFPLLFVLYSESKIRFGADKQSASGVFNIRPAQMNSFHLTESALQQHGKEQLVVVLCE